MKKNIFVACDFSSEDETVKLIEQIKNDIFGIKVGLQYIASTGIEGIKAVPEGAHLGGAHPGERSGEKGQDYVFPFGIAEFRLFFVAVE